MARYWRHAPCPVALRCYTSSLFLPALERSLINFEEGTQLVKYIEWVGPDAGA